MSFSEEDLHGGKFAAQNVSYNVENFPKIENGSRKCGT
jgi:hypothetical protein